MGVFHNCVVHPLLGVFQGLADLFGWLHDKTAPR